MRLASKGASKKDLEVAFKKSVENGDISYLHDLHYISNNAKTIEESR